jgi:hypothetical protein
MCILNKVGLKPNLVLAYQKRIEVSVNEDEKLYQNEYYINLKR